MTWTWKKLIFTALGIVLGIVVLAAVAGAVYLNMPVPVAGSIATSTVPTTITVSLPPSVAGADFTSAVDSVYADIQEVRAANTKLEPVLNQILSRIADANYAGIYSLRNTALAYTQEGAAAAKKLTADTQSLGLSEQSIGDTQVLTHTSTFVGALKQYTPILSSYYAALDTALKAPSTSNVSAFKSASQDLTTANIQTLQPQLNAYFTFLGNLVTSGQATASSTASAK